MLGPVLNITGDSLTWIWPYEIGSHNHFEGDYDTHYFIDWSEAFANLYRDTYLYQLQILAYLFQPDTRPDILF